MVDGLFVMSGLFVVHIYNLKVLMLGIFSWNIGDNAPKKIPLYIKKIKETYKPQSWPDLLVFGFQEVSEDLTAIMTNQLPDYTIINGIIACKQFTTY